MDTLVFGRHNALIYVTRLQCTIKYFIFNFFRIIFKMLFGHVNFSVILVVLKVSWKRLMRLAIGVLTE